MNARLRGWKRRVRAFGWRFLRSVWVSLRRYLDDQGSLRAGGLTYLTLMSLVPGLTVVLLIASAFGVKEQFRAWVDANVVGSSEQLVLVKETVLDLVENVRIELLGAFGLLLFVWVVLSLLARVEHALNATWQAGRSRTFARRYADYVAMLFLVPLLVLAATALETVVTLGGFITSVPLLGQIVRSGLDLVPMAMIWLALTLVYKVMPNVTVAWGPASTAGILAGTSWYVAQSSFLHAQIGISRNNAIYGSLALLPFLLFYLYLSWSIVLWGAEFCYVLQNRITMHSKKADRIWTPDQRRRLALGLFRGALDEFESGKALALADFAGASRWPRRRVDEIAQILADAGLVHRVKKEQAVVPAKPPGTTPVAAIFCAVDGIRFSEGAMSAADAVAVDAALAPREADLLRDLHEVIRDRAGML